MEPGWVWEMKAGEMLPREEGDGTGTQEDSSALGMGMGRCEIRDVVKLSRYFVFKQSWKHS